MRAWFHDFSSKTIQILQKGTTVAHLTTVSDLSDGFLHVPHLLLKLHSVQEAEDTLLVATNLRQGVQESNKW